MHAGGDFLLHELGYVRSEVESTRSRNPEVDVGDRLVVADVIGWVQLADVLVFE
jgi:hypothetical protein